VAINPAMQASVASTNKNAEPGAGLLGVLVDVCREIVTG
jgi:hypothetical protein